jgi:hypothetical protein
MSHWIPAFAGMTRIWDSSASGTFFRLNKSLLSTDYMFVSKCKYYQENGFHFTLEQF